MARNRKLINVALQGGGSHGAYTWGVLDRLLEDERLEIEAITGASAGAVNAVVLADGLARGGRDGARAALDRFWRRIGEFGNFSLFRRSPMDRLMGSWSLDMSPAYTFADLLSRLVSPYELNPLDINPMRDVLGELVDFAAIQQCSSIKLFISATNVRTGRIRVFDQAELCLDQVMASTCLPMVFQAVEIDGEHYWDGGYMGNPPIWPLFSSARSRDVLIVEINPIERDEVPTNARDILNRLNEVTFNTALIAELRAIDFVGRLVEEGRLEGDRYRKFLIHMVRGSAGLVALGSASKMNAEAEFLEHLRNLGREAADAWLAAHFDDLGQRGTLELDPLVHAAAPQPAQALRT